MLHFLEGNEVFVSLAVYKNNMLDPTLTPSISCFVILAINFFNRVSHVSSTDYVILVEQQQHKAL